ncbi:putative low-affinity inorganic phosphate transporter [Caenispirillum salinarum AK4]|uniref:Phosphate transporter n=1 Tax=Caenispirillum salinarum AK4 TaxID=1238182 RepID=K9GZM3_9PROT|nr:inorganic phosphate transporter [Caenispirillum salinarum]EKV30742.1 putative low-affinity inorganic phosphate transporter [Caenispirillum salinarum AK4]
MAKSTLDKDLKKISRLESATAATGRTSGAVGLALLFLVAVFAFTVTVAEGQYASFVIAAGVIGGYMALNIGANDVANNVGPAVGSKALTMVGALVVAAIFEAAGAIIAGGEVVSTVSKGIVDPTQLPSTDVFVRAMMSALLAGALWINLATIIGAPVSTTHSIVGGVLGAGVAAAGFGAVDWATMGAIAASWVISPALGGGIAALVLAFVTSRVLEVEDKIAAARRWVPALVGLMTFAFSLYLVMKGLKKVWVPPAGVSWLIALVAALGAWALTRPMVHRRSVGLENRRKSVGELFRWPLIFSAALLSFAHGANDVANAVGPLAAVVAAVQGVALDAKVAVPGWVLLVGALGIVTGLLLFGPKLIRTVGEKITRLDPARAFCVALAAAVTVIVASEFGLPVSSTHIAVGGIFGVGFYREFRANRYTWHWHELDPDAALTAGGLPTAAEGGESAAAETGVEPQVLEKRRRKAEKARRRRLVRRRHLLTIVAAWLVTVPLAALLSAAIFGTWSAFL